MNLYIFIFGGVWDFLTVRIMIRLSLLWRMIQGRGKKYGNKRGMPPTPLCPLYLPEIPHRNSRTCSDEDDCRRDRYNSHTTGFLFECN